VLGLTLLSVSGRGTNKPVLSIQYRDSVEVLGPSIKLGDIALIRGEANVVEMLKQKNVGPAAKFGLIRHLDTRSIYRRYLVPLLSSYRITGELKKVIRIKTLSKILTKDSLASLVYQKMEKLTKESDKDYKFEFSRLPDFVRIPKVAHILKINIPSSFRAKGNQNLSLQILINNKIVRRVSLGVNISVYDSVWVAVDRIGRGEVVHKNNIKREYREVTDLHSLPLNLSQLMGLEARQTIVADRIMVGKLLIQKPIVLLGQSVTIRSLKKGIEIEFKGVARQNGKLGQVIQVKNLMSHKLIRARIIDENTLEWISTRG